MKSINKISGILAIATILTITVVHYSQSSSQIIGSPLNTPNDLLLRTARTARSIIMSIANTIFYNYTLPQQTQLNEGHELRKVVIRFFLAPTLSLYYLLAGLALSRIPQHLQNKFGVTK